MFFCRQLHVLLLSIVAAAVLSIGVDAVRMRLLWLSIICFVLFMQLQLILMVFRLKIFLSL